MSNRKSQVFFIILLGILLSSIFFNVNLLRDMKAVESEYNQIHIGNLNYLKHYINNVSIDYLLTEINEGDYKRGYKFIGSTQDRLVNIAVLPNEVKEKEELHRNVHFLERRISTYIGLVTEGRAGTSEGIQTRTEIFMFTEEIELLIEKILDSYFDT